MDEVMLVLVATAVDVLIILLFRDVVSKANEDRFVVSLGLATSLRMVCGSGDGLYTKQGA